MVERWMKYEDNVGAGWFNLHTHEVRYQTEKPDTETPAKPFLVDGKPVVFPPLSEWGVAVGRSHFAERRLAVDWNQPEEVLSEPVIETVFPVQSCLLSLLPTGVRLEGRPVRFWKRGGPPIRAVTWYFAGIDDVTSWLALLAPDVPEGWRRQSVLVSKPPCEGCEWAAGVIGFIDQQEETPVEMPADRIVADVQEIAGKMGPGEVVTDMAVYRFGADVIAEAKEPARVYTQNILKLRRALVVPPATALTIVHDSRLEDNGLRHESTSGRLILGATEKATLARDLVVKALEQLCVPAGYRRVKTFHSQDVYENACTFTVVDREEKEAPCA